MPTSTTKEPVKKLLLADNHQYRLRDPNERVVSDYAEMMAGGEHFPPVRVGVFSKDGKEVKQIVDGMHRIHAAGVAKIETLDTETVNYQDEKALLLDMLAMNSGRGMLVTAHDRDARIRLLATAGMGQVQIAKAIGLTQGSVSRIIAHVQEAGKTGTGARAGKKPTKTKVDAMTPKAFFTALDKVCLTLDGGGVQEIASYVLPEGDDDHEQSEEHIELIAASLSWLTQLTKQISKASK